MASKKKHRKTQKPGLSPGTLVYTGDRTEKPALVRSVYYSPSACRIHNGYDSVPSISDDRLWIDIRNLSDIALIQRIGTDFGINALALEDVLNTQQRAKLDDYEDALFLIVPNLSFDSQSLELRSEQIAVFANKTVCVTFQEDPDDTFAPLIQRIQEGNGRIRKKGLDYLFYAVTDVIVDNYFLALDKIEDILLDIENDIYVEGVCEEQKARIFQIKYAVGQFRHRVYPLREVMSRLIHTECDFLDPANSIFIRDLSDHVSQVLDKIESYREHVINLESLYHAEINTKLNETMRLLTIISTIFIPLSFVAGVYGMNFNNMPELRTRNGYFIVLTIMFLTLIGMLIYFKKKKWL